MRLIHMITMAIAMAVGVFVGMLAYVTVSEAAEMQPLPERDHFLSPTIMVEVHKVQCGLQRVRQQFPQAEFTVQLWANDATGALRVLGLVNLSKEFNGKTLWKMVLMTHGTPSPYEYRNANPGFEVWDSLRLGELNWYYGGQDI